MVKTDIPTPCDQCPSVAVYRVGLPSGEKGKPLYACVRHVRELRRFLGGSTVYEMDKDGNPAAVIELPDGPIRVCA